MASERRAWKAVDNRARALSLLLGVAGCWFGNQLDLRADPLPLPLADQARVERAISRGVAYLKSSQGSGGSWAPAQGATHPYGFAALPALTLLECGVPATHPAIGKAISYLSQVPIDQIQNTYEVALTVLFLDRLSAFSEALLARAIEKDRIRTVIEVLALRLIAAQKVSGGWGYTCPPLTVQRHKLLKAALAAEKGKLKLAPRSWLSTVSCLQDQDRLMGKESKDGSDTQGKVEPKDAKAGRTKNQPVVDTPAGQVDAQATDNSCTQFAMLAVWVAQRHEVPVDKSIKLVVRRFRTSQNSDGGWGYKYKRGGGEPTTPQMICAGLLGFAVEYGVEDPIVGARTETAKKATLQLATTVSCPSIVFQYLAARAVKKAAEADTEARKRTEEDRTRRAIVALGAHVGQPIGRFIDLPQSNLYYLWALERVALLYNLQTIGGKDWYRWGAEQLIANQKPGGNWEKGQTGLDSPIVDTCFALLFLSQANLTEGLTDKLKQEAQMVNNPPVKNEPQPGTTIAATIPPAPPPIVAPAQKPEERTPPPETKPTAPEPRPQIAEPAPSSNRTKEAASKPAEGSNDALLWGSVIGGVVLVGVLALVLILVLKKSGGSEFDEDDEEEEEERPRKKTPAKREKQTRRQNSKARPHKGDRPKR